MFIQYNSITEFAADFRKRGLLNSASHWATPRQKLQDLENGNEQLVAEAERIMAQLEDESVVTTGKVWQPHVFGPIVSVPDYLTGTPTPFRHQKDTESTETPIRVVASICSSASISRDQLLRRGLAVSALVMKLQAIRPVELIAFTEMEGDGRYNYNENRPAEVRNSTPGHGRSIVALKIESKPLSLAHAINILSDSNIARTLFYNTHSSYIGRHAAYWPEDWRTPEYYKWLGEQFQLDEETDIIVPSSFTAERIATDPIGWVNDNLAKLGYREEN